MLGSKPVNFRCTYPLVKSTLTGGPCIYRSGLVDIFSKNEFELLHTNYHVTTWFDLRNAAEKKEFNPDLFININYYAFPLHSDCHLPNRPTALDYLTYYQTILLTNKAVLNSFFVNLTTALTKGSCVISCYAGKDRTGIMCYLIHCLMNTPIYLIKEDFVNSEKALLNRADIFGINAQKKQLPYETYQKRFSLCDEIFELFHTWFCSTYNTIEDFFFELALTENYTNQLKTLLRAA